MVHSGKVWQFLTEFNLHLPYGPAILFLDNYTREMKTYVCTKTCMQMSLDVFSSITHNHQTLKQPKWPSVNKWINELWYNLQWKYCPVAKMKKLLIHRTTWLNLQCIMLNKKIQSQNVAQHMIPFIWYSGIVKEHIFWRTFLRIKTSVVRL